jgi:crotonobetainyl-CoA:carnitine CoA-transferase CaiB-like acyl-CoA transferase
MGAEVIKVEHKTKPDFIRWGNGMAPDGGREERDRSTGPLRYPRPASPNRSGFFMEINSGKRAISLNLKHPRGKEILTRLLKTADIVAEGFSPGTMDRMGFGYARLKEINPRIVYAQQSGMGQIGTYGGMRSYGPVAQAFSGLSEMSGFPEPYPPAGIGYSFLDWSGAYNMAVAIMAGLYRQRVTGKGCWIDSSQVESGTYLTGTAILDYEANGRRWYRYGNRSPYRSAAPHGAYRTKGDDRWIAIACFTEEEWKALVEVLGRPGWAKEARFRDLDQRTQHQDELDALVNAITADREGYQLTDQLQRAGVPAGVCQTAADRYDVDPQLKHLQWMVELKQSEIGTWPVKEFPVKFSETPPYMGGTIERHGPNYGEDNEYVYGELLGMSSEQIRELKEAEVI